MLSCDSNGWVAWLCLLNLLLVQSVSCGMGATVLSNNEDIALLDDSSLFFTVLCCFDFWFCFLFFVFCILALLVWVLGFKFRKINILCSLNF